MVLSHLPPVSLTPTQDARTSVQGGPTHLCRYRKKAQQIHREKIKTSPMLTRKPSLQVLPSFVRILGLGFVPVPGIYPTEAVADPALGRAPVRPEHRAGWHWECSVKAPVAYVGRHIYTRSMYASREGRRARGRIGPFGGSSLYVPQHQTERAPSVSRMSSFRVPNPSPKAPVKTFST